jgi:hypothetical protein
MNQQFRVQHRKQTPVKTWLVEDQLVTANTAEEALFIASKGALAYSALAYQDRDTTVVRTGEEACQDVWIAEVLGSAPASLWLRTHPTNS